MDPVTGDDSFVERESRLGTIPADKVVNRTSIAPLGFWRSQAYQHGRFGVL